MKGLVVAFFQQPGHPLTHAGRRATSTRDDQPKTTPELTSKGVQALLHNGTATACVAKGATQVGPTRGVAPPGMQTTAVVAAAPV
jgi:hypothetical protein